MRPRTVPLRWLIAAWAVMLGGLALGWAMRSRFESVRDWLNLATLCLFVPGKAASLMCLPATDFRRLGWGRLLAYLFYPGMQPRQFLMEVTPADAVPRPTLAGIALNTLAAAFYLWVLPSFLPEAWRWPRIISGVAGYFHLALFVVMDVWTLLYRAFGIGVTKLWHCPVAATSLIDFWGNRWNRVFSGMLRETLFMPLARRVGTGVAVLIVFLYSGVLHENFSVAANSGYGTPTLYFVIQVMAVWVESKWRWLRGGWTGWLWTVVVVLGPVTLLFQPTFVEVGMVPTLVKLGVPGLEAVD